MLATDGVKQYYNHIAEKMTMMTYWITFADIYPSELGQEFLIVM